MVTFSTGRVAHITVRDPHGRPAVAVNFLRSSSKSSQISFLGGIKNALGGGFWRKDLAAVRAGESHQRGQRDVIIATSSGVVEIWDTHWNNGSVLKKQFDIKDALYPFLGLEHIDGCGFKILDLALKTGRADTAEPHLVTLVIALPSDTTTNKIALVQLALSNVVHVISSTPIDLYNVFTGHQDFKLQLLVPEPGDTAFIIVGQSIILSSLAPTEASSLNFHSSSIDSNRQSQNFYDVINLRSGEGYEILGAGLESQNVENSSPACLAMVRDFGIIRITALPRQKIGHSVESIQITAKQKIEQAVFYGAILGNPLNLNNRNCLDFSVDEIEQAALEICGELLRSASRYVPTTAISVDQNLRSRAKALDDLACLLMEQQKKLNHRIWWELLWSAEKLAAQRALWKIEDCSRRGKVTGSTFLGQVIEMMSEKFKTNVGQQDDGNDPVRNWLLYDTYRMEHIVPWIFNAIKPQKGHSSRQGRKISEQVLEASELSLAVLETAFRYRDEHASQYGIGDGYLEDGVLIAGYKDLPEFWTSKGISYLETGHLLDLELDSCRLWVQKTLPTSELPENEVLRKLARNSARKLQVLSKMHSERIRWLSAQEDPKLTDESIAIEQAHVRQRRWQLFKLAGIGQLEDAITMAEKFRDMGALVELIIELQDQTNGENPNQSLLGRGPSVVDIESEQLGKKISFYFEKFGEPWADAFFSRQISMGQSGILFAMGKFQPYITQFLHKYPAYSRLGWINDVVGENDYDAAARSLENLAIEHESDIWSHRVELSLAKLAKLATWEERTPPNNSSLHNDIRRLEDLVEIDTVQEVIHSYITPTLQGAIDQKATIDLAIEHFGQSLAEDMPSLHEILSEALTRVITRQVVGVEQLVDILTLMDPSHDPEFENEFVGKEFYLALRVIRLSPYAQRDSLYRMALQKLVWRRCMINDNWISRGKAVQETDGQFESFLYDTALSRTLTLCLQHRQTEDSNYPTLYVPNYPGDVELTESDSKLLVSRFPPEQRNRISHDLDRENQILSQHVENGKLEFWFNSFLTSAHSLQSTAKDADAIEHTTIGEQLGGQTLQSSKTVDSKLRLSWL
ncbi:hypothetical protein EYZ11_007120 [Aspergillus tanneri]|nr:hypothetical protein EYZ11_007120 [Aspergillus tanneri]